MTKILYISNFKDGTGWSHAATNYVLAMDAAGLDVVPRNIKLNGFAGEVNKRILELEQKSDKDCDVVIQHVLPHMMDYDGNFRKNIGLFVAETTNFKMSSWPTHLNNMDEIWIPCKSMVDCCLKSGVVKPLKIVPHSADMSKYQKIYKRLPIPEVENTFVFYYIGENVRRKNLISLLKAFHLEFSPSEPVSLCIKTSHPGLNSQQCGQELNELCQMVKTNLKLYNKLEMYKQEIIITEILSEEDIMNLHNTCDCFVTTSLGESWCIPAFDAMAMGKTPICTNVGGMRDYIKIDDEFGGWLVPGYEEPVFGALDTFNDLYTGYENWTYISINALRKTMREAFENIEERKIRASNGIKNSFRFSNINIGQLIKEIL